jgi:hypothetical protein
MNLVRNGKIARFPKHLGDELNRRLDHGEHGQPLLQCFNSQPEVRALSVVEVGGRPVNKPTQPQWRRGGCAGWVRQPDSAR